MPISQIHSPTTSSWLLSRGVRTRNMLLDPSTQRRPGWLSIRHLLRGDISRIVHPCSLPLPIAYLQLLLTKRARPATNMSATIADGGSRQIVTVSDFIPLADIAPGAAEITPALFFNGSEGLGVGGEGTYDEITARECMYGGRRRPQSFVSPTVEDAGNPEPNAAWPKRVSGERFKI